MTSEVIQPSPEQAAFYDWIENGTGSAVLEAVAGAGKTTSLVNGVKLMVGSVFLGAFNRDVASELKERIAGIQGKKAGTFHSAGYSALRRSNANLQDPDDKKVRDIVQRLIEDLGRDPLQGEVPAVCHLVSLAKQTGFHCRGLVPNVQPRYWMELIRRHDVSDRLPEDYEDRLLVELADSALRESNHMLDVIDYDDMIYLPLFLNLRMFQNDWVLIDEAQDTNAVRRALAAKMLRRGGRLVAVGDPHQAIYGFTGADNDSLELIRQQFSAVTLRLSVSWRCPRSVVAVAREYVGHINPSPSAKEGRVCDMSYGDMVGKVGPGDAVLCRFNSHLVDLCFALIRAGKPAKIQGRAIGEGLVALVSRWKVKTLDALEGRLEKWFERERAKIEASAKPDDQKLERLEDQYATVLVLVQRGREKGMTRLEDLQNMIRDMFADVGNSKSLVVLSSVHRSKGLEWPTVYILGRRELMPSPRARQQWQKEQEINLCYVAVTRAKMTLVDVAMPSKDDLKPKAGQHELQVAEEAGK